MNKQKCSTCRKCKDLNHFNKAIAHKTGYRYECKMCQSDYRISNYKPKRIYSI